MSATDRSCHFPSMENAATTRERILQSGLAVMSRFGLGGVTMEYDPQPPFDAGSPEKAGTKVVNAARALIGQFIESGRNPTGSKISS
jgi:hypothetical protein